MYPVAILAGGLATRLKPLTENLPKSLIEVHGEPFIAHQLRLMHSLGISQVVVCIGHLGDMIKEVVGSGDRFGVEVTYSRDHPQLGTGGALRHALPLLGNNFFVTYGDSYLECDYAAIQQQFDREALFGLLVVTKNLGKWHANVHYNHGEVYAVDKIARTNQPFMRHIDFGLGVLNYRALSCVPAQQPYSLADVYAELAKCGELSGYEVNQPFFEIGSVGGLEQVRQHLNPV